MKILGLDTSSDACSVAVFDTSTSKLIAEESVPLQRGHAELLFSQITRVMSAAGTELDMVGRFAVTTGPGTFTGVRIGLAAARGLALAAGRPLIGVGSLEVIAATADTTSRAVVVAAIDARRGELYVQGFLAGRAITEAFAAPADEAAARLTQAAPSGCSFEALGTGASAIVAALGASGHSSKPLGGDPFPQASALVRLAAQRPIPLERPQPLYLRAPDAKLPAAQTIPGGA